MILDRRYELLEPPPLDDRLHRLAALDQRDSVEVVASDVSIAELSPARRRDLEREAKAVRGVESPCLPRVLDVGCSRELFFLVAERVSGTSLRCWVDRTGPLPVDDALTVGCSVLRALADLHAAGVVHGGVHPENVIVAGVAGIERTVLVGVQFPRALGSVSAEDDPRDHIRYLSPEAAGLLSSPVDGRSDLYSAGVVLFEALAGGPPFAGEELGDLLRQHLSAVPARLAAARMDVPPALDDVIQHLLAKDPADRYPSASAALHDLETIGDELRRGVTDPQVVVRSIDHRALLREPEMVGRDAELAELERHLERAREGYGGVVVVAGESGAGKSRLLDALAGRAIARGGWVVRGRGLHQEPERPLGLLAALGEDVARSVRSDPAHQARLQRDLADVRHRVVEALPVLDDVLGPAPPVGGAAGPPGEAPTLGALTCLLDSLGTAAEPALVLLDDCQWSDDVTTKLLVSWHSGAKRPRHVLVVVAYRSEDVADEHPLRTLDSAPAIVLSPLDRSQIHEVVESMAGALPTAAHETILRLSKGSPFMAQAVLRGLVESGALVAGTSSWQVDLEVLGNVQASRQAAAVLARRVELLPPGTVRLLSIGAVIGREFDIDMAARLAGQPVGEARDALSEAARRHIVWVTVPSAAFVHDRLREEFLGRLTAEDRRSLHRAVALELQASGGRSDFELAYHFDAAGAHDLALPFALAGAQQARAQYALALAEQLYRIAERGLAPSDLTARRLVAQGLGDVLMLRGEYAEATRRFQEALPLTKDELATARLEGQLGELAFKQDQVDEASEWFQRGLRLLGHRIPGGRIALLVRLVWEALIQLAHRLVPWTVRQRRPEEQEHDLLAAYLHSRLGFAWWLQGGGLRLFWAALRQVNFSERHPPSEELGLAYATIGVALTATWPRFVGVGIRLLKRSLEVRRHLGNLWGQGQALHFYGVVLHAAGRYGEAVRKFDEAVVLLERTGDRWELNTARWHRALCRYRLGELKEAIEEAKSVLRDASVIGDVEASGVAVQVWAKASGGDVAAEVVGVELERRSSTHPDVQTTVGILEAEGLRLLRQEQVAEAVEVLEEAARRVEHVKVRNVYVASVASWRATALRCLAQAGTASAAEQRAAVRRAEQAARVAVRVARRYRNDLPHALREAGLTAALGGRVRRARRLVDASIALSEGQGARYELGLSLRARAELGRFVGWPGTGDDADRADLLFSELGARDGREGRDDRPAPTLSLADRFDTLLGAGRELTSRMSRQEILLAAREATMTLLRAEDCLVIDISTLRRGGREPADPAPRWDPATIEEAVASGKPVISNGPEEESAGAPTDTVAVSMRSAICVPIFVHKEPAACLYATHSHVAGLFGDEEYRLAEFISSLAGAALEREQLRHETRARAVEAQEGERARVSRDLHDQVGQGLTSAMLSLRLLEDALGTGRTEEALGKSAVLRDLLGDVLQDVRIIAFELRPTVLDDLGLPAALQRLIRDVEARHDLSVTLAVQGLDHVRLAPEVETTAYRVTQEALTNVVRHSGATTCCVRVARRAGGLEIAISDDGAGFDPSVVPDDSLGLRGMAERAELVGGVLTLSSSADGSTVVLEVPLP
jgi:signal transduction histidine kinase